MNSIEDLKQLLNYIRHRLPDEEKIDAAEHNRILNKLVDTLVGIGADVFKGNATPETIPDIPSGKCFYLATKKGIYTYFGDLTVNSHLAVLTWNGIDWEKHEIEVSVNIDVDINDYIDLSGFAKLTCDNTFVGNQQIIGDLEVGETRGKLRPVARTARQMEQGQATVWDDLLKIIKTVKQVPDAILFDSHAWKDFFDQALRTTDPVQFKSVLSTIFQTIGFSEGVDGFKVDERGNIFARSLKLFDFLETPELRYNKITVIGDEFWITTGGVIDEVLPDGTEDNKYTIRLKLEGNNVNTFDEGDICKGIFETELGFQSCYFIVVSSTDEPNFSSGVMDIVLTGYMVAPRRFMNIARIGNVLDEKPERQRSGRVNARNGTVQFYEKVNTWEITVKNMAVHIGECKNAGLPGVDVNMEGNIIWADKMFARLGVTTFDADGVVIPDIVFMGEWETGKTYTRNNEVGYMGCVYRCIAGSTTSIPRYDNPDWFMTQGNPNFEMRFTSSNGTRFIGNDIDTEIIATVFKYNQDISDDLPVERWTWTRTSDFPESDVEWNAKHVGTGNHLHLTRADFPGDGIRKQTIYCTAFIDAVTSVKEQLNIKI